MLKLDHDTELQINLMAKQLGWAVDEFGLPVVVNGRSASPLFNSASANTNAIPTAEFSIPEIGRA